MTKSNSTLSQKALLLLVGGIFGLVLAAPAFYPLLPTRISGWLALLGAGFLVGVWGATGYLLISWIQAWERQTLFSRMLSLLVALSVGMLIFGFALLGHGFLGANFRYFFV